MKRKKLPPPPARKGLSPLLDLEAMGENISQARRRIRINQFRLAELVGVHPNYVSQLECGRKEPSLSLLARIRDALGLTWEELFLRDGEPTGAANGRKIEEFERRQLLRGAERLSPDERSAFVNLLILIAKRDPEPAAAKGGKTKKSAAAAPVVRLPRRIR